MQKSTGDAEEEPVPHGCLPTAREGAVSGRRAWDNSGCPDALVQEDMFSLARSPCQHGHKAMVDRSPLAGSCPVDSLHSGGEWVLTDAPFRALPLCRLLPAAQQS